ncbi:MAG TPA: phosphotransferase [Acidimicrobiales bacterium]|nr:phosphotransferase [Acidimicrobiales bacterium]
MKPPGRLLAAGRDADIFEYGPGLVLRRSREGRSVVGEARVMQYLSALGFPVPAVEEVSDDGLSMVMERVNGTDMVAHMTKRPWTIARQGRVLADLHRRLHELDAPDWLRASPVGRGDRLLHLDLHPLNVMVTKSGPVVIDWTGACRGDPLVDTALAWVLMASGEVPSGRVLARVLAVARKVLVNAFVSSFDRHALEAHLGEVVAWKVTDPHMSEAEQARMWAMVERASRGR